MDRSEMYWKIYQSFVKAYSDKSKQETQRIANETWNKLKILDNNVLQGKVKELLEKNNQIAANKKGSLMSFWSKQPTASATQTKNLPQNKDSCKDLDPNDNNNCSVINEASSSNGNFKIKICFILFLFILF